MSVSPCFFIIPLMVLRGVHTPTRCLTFYIQEVQPSSGMLQKLSVWSPRLHYPQRIALFHHSQHTASFPIISCVLHSLALSGTRLSRDWLSQPELTHFFRSPRPSQILPAGAESGLVLGSSLQPTVCSLGCWGSATQWLSWDCSYGLFRCVGKVTVSTWNMATLKTAELGVENVCTGFQRQYEKRVQAMSFEYGYGSMPKWHFRHIWLNKIIIIHCNSFFYLFNVTSENLSITYINKLLVWYF